MLLRGRSELEFGLLLRLTVEFPERLVFWSLGAVPLAVPPPPCSFLRVEDRGLTSERLLRDGRDSMFGCGQKEMVDKKNRCHFQVIQNDKIILENAKTKKQGHPFPSRERWDSH